MTSERVMTANAIRGYVEKYFEEKIKPLEDRIKALEVAGA